MYISYKNNLLLKVCMCTFKMKECIVWPKPNNTVPRWHFCTRLHCMHQKLKYVILWTNASRDHKHFFIDICQLSSEIFILVKNLLQKNIFPAGIFPKYFRKNTCRNPYRNLNSDRIWKKNSHRILISNRKKYPSEWNSYRKYFPL